MHVGVLGRAVGHLRRRRVVDGCGQRVRGHHAVGAPVLTGGSVRRRPPTARRLAVAVRVHVGDVVVSAEVGVLWRRHEVLGGQADAGSSHGALVIHAALFIQKVAHIHGFGSRYEEVRLGKSLRKHA